MSRSYVDFVCVSYECHLQRIPKISRICKCLSARCQRWGIGQPAVPFPLASIIYKQWASPAVISLPDMTLQWPFSTSRTQQSQFVAERVRDQLNQGTKCNSRSLLRVIIKLACLGGLIIRFALFMNIHVNLDLWRLAYQISLSRTSPAYDTIDLAYIKVRLQLLYKDSHLHGWPVHFPWSSIMSYSVEWYKCLKLSIQ